METSSQWRDALRRLDIDSAYCHLHKYIGEAAPDNILSHPENFIPIFAAAELGEFETSRKILKNMLNPKFLESDINHYASAEGRALQTSEDKLQECLELDNVLAASALSQDWDLGRRVLRRARKLFPEYVHTELECTQTTDWKRLAWVGVIYERNNVPLEAFAILLKASQLVEQDRSLASDPNSRRGIFSSDPFGEIFNGLARLCIRAGDLGLPLAILDAYPHNHMWANTWQEHALLFLEQAKARNLLEYLAENQPSSMDTGAGARRSQKLRGKMKMLAQNTPSNPQESNLKTLEAELEGYEDEIDISGPIFDTKLTVNYENLYGAIAEDEIVIESDFSNHGFTLFGVTSTGIEFAQHRHKTWLEMRNLVARAMKHLVDYPKDKPSHSREDLEVILKEISDELLLPLQHLIRKKKHIIFIASQPLAAFPFSTLLLDGEPLFLRVAVSQVPSLGTLLHLWKSSEASRSFTETFSIPVSVCTIVKAAKLVKSGSGEPQEKLLFLAAIEAMIVARTFNTWPLEGSKIGREEFESLIQNQPLTGTDDRGARMRILHIGTHGYYDPYKPWMSSISLKEKFTVLDIGRMRSKGHRRMALIVFAACLSGMGQSTLGNDVIGFAQALLERDCNAYLGALWNVDDYASMLLMVLFYQHLWKSVAQTSNSSAQIAKLWQEAQKSFYHLTIDETKELIGELVQVLEDAERVGHDPKEFVKSWRSKLGNVVENMEKGKLDLKHPFNWGAFVVVGYGGIELVASQ